MTTTITKKIEVKSKGLMTGMDSCALLEPSSKKGIRFHLNNKTVEACLENVISTDHCTVVGNKDIQIMLIEHFMAACAVCNIDALDVYLTHGEIPILDGSSKKWVEVLKDSKQDAKETYRIKEPVYYLNGKTYLAVLPSDELSITYCVDFRHPDLTQRWVSLTKDNLSQIVEARTFGYLKELDMLQAAGFAKGVTIENTVGLTENGYTTNLLSEFEPAKHKILDLIGDFYLTGCNPLNLKAQIIAKEAGHTVHVKTAKLLKDKIVKEL